LITIISKFLVSRFIICAKHQPLGCYLLISVSQLVTAHIKKRSHCEVEEKLDSHIVMPMCKFGCDTLYEDGFLTVNDEGKYVRIDKVSRKKVTPYVDNILNDIEGKECAYWNKKTGKYFEWHHAYHTQS
jgi:hypothetical protein